MKNIKRIFRNISLITLGNGISILFVLLTNIYLARVLLPDNYGKVIYAQTLIQYLILVADLGLSNWGTREVAKRPERLSVYVTNILSFRFIASLLLLVLFSTIVFLQNGISPEMKILLITSGLFLIPAGLNIEWAWQGIEKMTLAGIFRITAQLFPLVLFLVFIRGASDYLIVPSVRFAGTIIITVAILLFLGIKISNISLADIKDYLKGSLYFWLMALLVQVYHGSDIVLLKMFRISEEVGLYSASFKMTAVLLMVFGWLNTSIFPALSNLASSDLEEFQKVRKIYLKISLLIGTVLVIISAVFGDKLILFALGGEYEGAIPVFHLLMIGVAILTLNGPYAQSLIALGFEKHILYQVIASAIANLTLNFILIPRYGIKGAAWSFIIAQFIATLWVMILFYRKYDIKRKVKLVYNR